MKWIWSFFVKGLELRLGFIKYYYKIKEIGGDTTWLGLDLETIFEAEENF